jgi:FG-GAP-like repeat
MKRLAVSLATVLSLFFWNRARADQGILWHNPFTGDFGVWVVNPYNQVVTSYLLSGLICGVAPWDPDNCSHRWHTTVTQLFPGSDPLGGFDFLMWAKDWSGDLDDIPVDRLGNVETPGRMITNAHCATGDGCASSWTVVGTGSFDPAHRQGLLWYNAGSNQLGAWLLSLSTNVVDFISVDACGGGSARPVATGDFNGDGNTDVLWNDDQNGNIYLCFLDGAGHVSASRLVDNRGGWWWDTNRIVGVADFNYDGHLDILWWDTSRGQLVTWPLDANDHFQGESHLSWTCGEDNGCSQSWYVVGIVPQLFFF